MLTWPGFAYLETSVQCFFAKLIPSRLGAAVIWKEAFELYLLRILGADETVLRYVALIVLS